MAKKADGDETMSEPHYGALWEKIEQDRRNTMTTPPPGSREAAQIASMKLPAGKTCADCCHGKHCDALFGAVRRGFTSCDFYPSRFSARGETK